MKYTVKIIYGEEQVEKYYNDEPLNYDEIISFVKEYSFNTEIEKNAFCKGLSEAVGWLECCVLEDSVSII